MTNHPPSHDETPPPVTRTRDGHERPLVKEKPRPTPTLTRPEEDGWGSMYVGCVAQTAYYQHDKTPPPFTASPRRAIADANIYTG